MGVGILLITHESIGPGILKTVKHILGELPADVKTLEIPFDTDVDSTTRQGINLADELDTGDGVLILIDIIGGTPGNIAHSLGNARNINIVSGLNLPMLIRVLNYASLSLQDLSIKADSGGHDGIVIH